jgi:hypothetical protein
MAQAIDLSDSLLKTILGLSNCRQALFIGRKGLPHTRKLSAKLRLPITREAIQDYRLLENTI